MSKTLSHVSDFDPHDGHGVDYDWIRGFEERYVQKTVSKN